MDPKFRIASITDEFSPADPARSLAQMASIGMTGAELRVLWGKNIMDLNDDEMARLRHLLQGHGMEVISIASPILKCVLPNGPEMASSFIAVASGTSSAPLNPAYRADEFEFYLDDLKILTDESAR